MGRRDLLKAEQIFMSFGINLLYHLPLECHEQPIGKCEKDQHLFHQSSLRGTGVNISK